mgnify:CR=1 FL=1
MKILDACCGSKMFWFDREHKETVYMDNRTLDTTLCDGRKLIVKPDVIADFRKMPFEDESFDIIFHPVSNSYIEKVEPVFKECYRILKKGGILLCGLDIGTNYIVDEKEEKIINSLPFNPLVNEEQRKQLEEQDCGIQFSHTISEQIGGQLKAGFTLLDIYEDTNGSGRLHEMNIKTYIATKSAKLSK